MPFCQLYNFRLMANKKKVKKTSVSRYVKSSSGATAFFYLSMRNLIQNLHCHHHSMQSACRVQNFFSESTDCCYSYTHVATVPPAIAFLYRQMDVTKSVSSRLTDMAKNVKNAENGYTSLS